MVTQIQLEALAFLNPVAHQIALWHADQLSEHRAGLVFAVEGWADLLARGHTGHYSFDAYNLQAVIATVPDDYTHAVGCLCFSQDEDETLWWLDLAYVNRQWRRKGVFDLMTIGIKQLAKETPNVRKIQVGVAAANGPMHGAMKSLGVEDFTYYALEIDRPCP